MTHHDVVVAGGGPAGLSAALTFGRARRRALLVDGGTPRNARAEHVHTFHTRDGTPPSEMRAAAHRELAAYPGVERRSGLVVSAERDGDGLSVELEGGERVSARKLLVSTGVRDVLPVIEGLSERWGRSVFTCPYCHGWEARDRPWAVLAATDALAEWSLLSLGWTDRLSVLTDGQPLGEAMRARLLEAGVRIFDEPLARLVGPTGDLLEAVELRSGERVACQALVLRPVQRPSALVERLGLELDQSGVVKVDARRESSMPGVHVAGDAATMMQGAILAAAEGMMAAGAMNHSLVLEAVASRRQLLRSGA